MEIDTVCCLKEELLKHAIEPKATKKDGQHASYNSTGVFLAVSNNRGDIIVIDFVLRKFWSLGFIALGSTLIKFSPFQPSDLLVGGEGFLHIVDANNGTILAILEGHRGALVDASFSDNHLLITSTSNEAIIWRTEKYEKLRVLVLEEGTILKSVVFMPISNNVMTCYQNDAIQAWKSDTLEPINQIIPNVINRITVKTIAFTRNGRAMVIGGYSPQLLVFMIDIWKAVETLTLPENFRGVKQLEFLPQHFDAGANKILIALTTNRFVIFIDMEKEELITKLECADVSRISVCPLGKQIGCVTNSGDVRVFAVAQIFEKYNSKEALVHEPYKPGIVLRKPNYAKVKQKMRDVLDLNKLRGILKEFNAYPDLYRRTIWSFILGIPNNAKQYEAIVRNVYDCKFLDLESYYPIENKRDLKNLKRTLSDLVSWCPFFSEVTYLPTFVFPFTRFLQSEPIICFEVVMTIIVNFCQYWFEYHPLPPVNVLGMIENILMEHDSELVCHLHANAVTSKLYAWSLLKSAFSEIVCANDWLIIWDHIISNEPSFVLFAVAAYSLINRNYLLAHKGLDYFNEFYHNQNPLDFKRFIAKIYQLLANTTENNQPRQYLDYFIPRDTYPEFEGFPQSSLQYDETKQAVQKENKDMLRNEQEFMRTRCEEIDKLKDVQRESEEMMRLSELRELYANKMKLERKSVCEQRERLRKFRSRIAKEESELLSVAKMEMLEKTCKDKRRTLETLQSVKQNVSLVEEELLEHYKKLLKHKLQIERLMRGQGDTTGLTEEYRKLEDEILKARVTANSTEYLKQLNVATGLAAMDNLIGKVQSEIEKRSKSSSSDSTNTLQITKLSSESKELGEEIKNLMSLLSKIK
ncbi:PREDICTED: TBC1 domain family member 31 [Nicrophorus vespilloides]|uniref:TBC1 domain family member 31 n=1 Tax=Nicrophorus vespilloides TaxID=110193 RepID=A0ABM1M4U6_NICVS|nr:PREDICTED: TBC1 domain family member 31 [Nicrophorus vespilloides]